jgi:hypothetical protein
LVRDELDLRVRQWSHLGERSYADGTREVGRIPHAGSHAFLHTLLRSQDREATARIQEQIGIRCPPALAQILEEYSGMFLFHHSFYLFGVVTQFSRSLEAVPQPYDIVQYNTYSRPLQLPPDYFVCGGYGYDVSSVLADDQGQVYLCRRDGSNVVGLGCDLQAFVLEEFDRIALLHNDKGKLGVASSQTVHPAIRA